jgi:repressor LexA
MAITRRQKEVIDFLSGFTQKNGYSPSYEEIASGLGLSLQRAHNRSRSIDVLPARSGKKGSDRLPLMGRIAAGQPVEAIETAESISLSDIIGNREVFALEVRGDSMRDEHIVSGDYVLVERTRTAREGEIIVALIDGADATLKRFYREGSMVRLQPSNTEMSPIYAPAANVSIQGKVLGVLRKYA